MRHPKNGYRHGYALIRFVHCDAGNPGLRKI
jgi:hypothetical protein